MATVYSLVSLLYVALLCVSSCAVEGRKAKADDTHHFQTFGISSLLPASICSPSNVPSTRHSTMELFHLYGPCSTKQNYNLRDILSNDEERVKSIHARVAAVAANSNEYSISSHHKNTDKKKSLSDTKVTIPARSGSLLGTGNYFANFGLGSPARQLSLIFDTGSDLTWTQCQPCVRSCYQQKDPIFNPSASTSYANVSCTSSQCSQLSSATSISPGCSTGTCVYGIQYGDRSFSVGFFSRDTLTITSNDVFPNFFFGCGQNNQGLFGSADGLIGLGRDPLSAVSQTAPKYGKYFSYCLPSTSSATGHLTFGKSAASTATNALYTPFASAQGTSFYYITVQDISVGGVGLNIGPSVFQTAGTIIDSGTVITRLPPAAYASLSTAFKKVMNQKYTSAPAYSILDTCFDFAGSTTITIPIVSFTFPGGIVKLPPNGILISVSTTEACLAFAGNSGATDVGIYGNTQQKTFEVMYDLVGGKLGFAPGGCS